MVDVHVTHNMFVWVDCRYKLLKITNGVLKEDDARMRKFTK